MSDVAEEAGPPKIEGGSSVEYLVFRCTACRKQVRFKGIWLSGAVPKVKVACETCGLEGDYKLHPTTWIDIMPLPTSPDGAPGRLSTGETDT